MDTFLVFCIIIYTLYMYNLYTIKHVSLFGIQRILYDVGHIDKICTCYGSFENSFTECLIVNTTVFK